MKQVKIMTWNLTSVKTVHGDQFASYFGYSLAVGDIDGDGAEDVVIGVPMYSDFSPSKNEYETGRVTIYYQGDIACNRLDLKCWVSKCNSNNK